MPPRKQQWDVLELAKRAKGSPLPLLLIASGLYGGQYARLFDKPFSDVASILCVVGAGTGFLLLVILSIRQTFWK